MRGERRRLTLTLHGRLNAKDEPILTELLREKARSSRGKKKQWGKIS